MIAPARAQAPGAATWPQRPPRIIVPFTPGGSPDVLARLLAEESSRRWPHTIVVENRPGAGGNIAADFVARSAPDGHTILLMSNNIVSVNPHISRMAFDPLTDLVPVALLARSPLVILVNQASPVQDIAGLIALVLGRHFAGLNEHADRRGHERWRHQSSHCRRSRPDDRLQGAVAHR